MQVHAVHVDQFARKLVHIDLISVPCASMHVVADFKRDIEE